MTIESSTIESDLPQIDGRRWVAEVHTDHLGVEHRVTWMADAGQEADAFLAARAEQIEQQLAQAEIDANADEVEGGGEV
jgi:hypothetical protein